MQRRLQCWWALPLSLFSFTACDNWELFQSDSTPLDKEPFVVSILNAEACPLPEGLDPKKVMIKSYNVRLSGHLKEGVPANYFYASLLTTDGSRYLADYPGCEPLLSGPPLSSGESAQGYLNFPIPPGKTPDKLVYAPELTVEDGEDHLVELSLNSTPSGETEDP